VKIVEALSQLAWSTAPKDLDRSSKPLQGPKLGRFASLPERRRIETAIRYRSHPRDLNVGQEESELYQPQFPGKRQQPSSEMFRHSWCSINYRENGYVIELFDDIDRVHVELNIVMAVALHSKTYHL